MFKRIGLSLVAVSLVTQTAMAQTPPPRNVSIELSLLVDVSGSVNTTEYNLQKTGYVNVFNNVGFWNAFQASGRTLAVQYAEWSSPNQQSGTAWTQIGNATEAGLFANAIGMFSRAGTGSTAVGAALNYGVNQLNTNNFAGERRIIDISGDGCNNNGVTAISGRNNAVLNNIIVNGITIGTENGDCGGLSLSAWYAANVVTSTGFLETADSFDDFNTAIERKIGRELGVNVVPEPGTFGILAAGLLALGVVAIRRRKQA